MWGRLLGVVSGVYIARPLQCDPGGVGVGSSSGLLFSAGLALLPSRCPSAASFRGVLRKYWKLLRETRTHRAFLVAWPDALPRRAQVRGGFFAAFLL